MYAKPLRKIQHSVLLFHYVGPDRLNMPACFLFFILFLMTFSSSGQTRISGFVKDQATGEMLIGAHVT